MLLSALTGHGHPSLARASRAAGSGDPWPVKATDDSTGPPSPLIWAGGQALFGRRKDHPRQQIKGDLLPCLLVKTDAPSIRFRIRGASSLCSSISTNRPYFRNRPERLRK